MCGDFRPGRAGYAAPHKRFFPAMHTVTAVPQGRFGRLLPFAALLVTMVSVQFGAAFSKQLFPVLGVERTTFVRLGLGALLLAPVLKPWKMRIARGECSPPPALRCCCRFHRPCIAARRR